MAKEAFYIFSYQDDPGESPGSPTSTYKAHLNPEKFTYQASIRFNDEENSSPEGSVKQTQGNDGGSLSVELLMDGTGVLPKPGDMNVPATVKEQLDELFTAVYEYDGEIHKPRYCIVAYGDFGFKCKLKSISVEYQLFNPDGDPLRAKASLSFSGHIPTRAMQLDSYKRSPDLSRILTIRQGDTLPILCQKIYKSPHYYLQVAEANGLTNFRELTVGSQLLFPPLEK